MVYAASNLEMADAYEMYDELVKRTGKEFPKLYEHLLRTQGDMLDEKAYQTRLQGIHRVRTRSEVEPLQTFTSSKRGKPSNPSVVSVLSRSQ